MADPGQSFIGGFRAGAGVAAARSGRELDLRRFGLAERAQNFQQGQAQRQLFKENFDLTLKTRDGLIEAAQAAIEKGMMPSALINRAQQFHNAARQKGVQLGIDLGEFNVGRSLQQSVQTPEGARSIAGADQRNQQNIAAEAPLTPSRRTVNVRDANGNQRTVVIDEQGNEVSELGAGPTVEFQPTELPGASKKDVTELDNAEIAVRNIVGTATQLRDDIRKSGPAALSAPGAVASGIQTLRAAAEGFAQLAGVDTERFEDGTATLNMDVKAEGIFSRLEGAANLNAVMKSAIVNLAFSAAAASGQTGRGVSDKDFERFVKELGAGASRPETFEAVLNRFVDRVGKNFQNRFRVQSRRIPGLRGQEPPDLTSEFTEQPSGLRATDFPEGTVITDGKGNDLVNRGGKWVTP